MRDLREIRIAAGQNIKERDYWISKLSGEPVKSSFIHDDQETTLPSRTIEEVTFKCDGQLFAQLMEVSKHKDHALHVILVTALVALLSRYTGMEDIIVGTPIYRQANEGEFINTVLIIRNRLNPDITFKELLVQVKQTVLEAVENQAFPVELLPELLNIPVSEDDFPLFDTALLLENIHEKQCIEHIPLNTAFRFLRTDESIEAVVEYNSSLYKASTVERIISHFTRLMEKTLSDLDLAVFDVEILSEEEKSQLLVDFNDTDAEYPADKTIHQLFEEQAERAGDKIAVIGSSHLVGTRFIASGTGTTSITYGELNEKSNQLAHLLMEKGVWPGSIVGIMMERSVEMVVGVLAILKAGGAYMPLDPNYPNERKRYILSDSNAKILITARNLSEGIVFEKEIIYFEDYKEKQGIHHSSFITHHSGHLAYIIYTSGSTGKPKGTLIEHRSVVNILYHLQALYPLEEMDSYLLKTNYTFDVSVTELFGWFFGNGKLVILEPDGEKNPDVMGESIARSKVTHINFVPSMLNVFLEALDDRLKEKLKSVRYIFVAGEDFGKTLARKVEALQTGIRFENIYGPTEATIYSTYYSLEAGQSGKVPIGKPLQNIKSYILDSVGHILPIGIPGELHIGGIGLARGYLNRPELTAEKFNQDLQDLQDYQDKNKTDQDKKIKQRFFGGSRGAIFQKSPPGGRRLYKTGDLARWLPEGNIEFLGRIDQQVKIRGFRIELGEIENQLLKHQDVKGAVVIPRSDETGDKFLCAYIVSAGGVEKTPDVADFTEFLSHALPGYMIPVYFVPLEKLPLSPNGKVDRKVLPAPETAAGRRYVAPRNPVEEKLADTWSRVLGIKRDSIGIDDNFFQLGGHSLKATILLSRIHREFDVQLAVSDMFKMPDIRKLSQYIEKAAKELYIPIEKTEKKEYYSLSPAQERLYVLNRMKLDGTGYNLAAIHLLEIAPDFLRLRNAFEKLIERHESFRTSFRMVDDQPVQKIHKEVEFDIEYYDLDNGEKEIIQNSKFKIQNSFIRPFDLSEAPLLRVGLIKKEDNEHILMMDMHHIITDGLSLEILTEELAVLYESKQVPPLKVQYKDCCEWQKREQKKEEVRAQEAYWLKTFEGEIPVLDLPNDFPRPSEQGFEGDTFYFELGSAEAEALMRLVKQEGVTLFMMLLAIYTILLAKLSSQDDIVVGSPASGRYHVDMEPVIGMFVNTLALQTRPMDSKTFKEFLREIKAVTLRAFEHQEYQFEELVEKVAVNRDLSRNPLFDVMIVLENIETPGPAKQELTFLPFKYRYDQSKFDLTLFAQQSNAALSFIMEYSTRLFKEETIRRFVRYFKRIASRVIDKPEKRLLEIELISPEEKNEILYDFNDTVTEYPSEKTIHQLYEEQVEKTPDNIAIVGVRPAVSPDHNPVSITYGELNRESGQLASLLLEKGVRPDTIVGIMVERSVEMVVGVLAILKAGGVYMPIDPDYPDERKRYMLSDSSARILITARNLSEGIVFEKEIIYFEDYKEKEGIHHSSFITHHSGHLAYIIYTSGTTGNPKGVMVTHRNVVRLVKNSNYMVFKEDDRILQTGALEFDASTFEIWGALLNGFQLHLTGKDNILIPAQLKTIIRKNRITTMWMTSPLFNQMLQEDMQIFAGLKNLLVGGDVLSLPHINKLRNGFPGLNIINGYGPTENTTFSTTFSIKKEYTHRIPIGSPISNSTVYILDKDDHLVPVGIYGEILVGGDGAARGYLNNPELTNDKFIENPYLLPMTNDQCPMTVFYRTGDLGRWLSDGNIEFLGRMDHQVKMRGFRIELNEIESWLLAHEFIKEAVVVAGEHQPGDQYLCAYIVCGEPPDGSAVTLSQLREFLSKKLPNYMIPSYFVILESIPLTPTGKVDRKALPEPEMGIDTDACYSAPRNRIEFLLVRFWSEILGIEEDSISIDANFFKLGGHSLRATSLISRILKEFSVNVPMSKIFKTATIRELAQFIEIAGRETYTSIPAATEKECFPVSSIQKRFFILDSMEGVDTAFNLPLVMMVEGKPGIQRLERAFQLLIQRHESLRTSFELRESEPVQIIHERVDFFIEHLEADERDIQEMIVGFITPFDLSKAPLLRVKLVKFSQEKHLLFIETHHIMSDGTSQVILMEDLLRFYEGKEPPPLRIQYKDFVEWQKSPAGRAAIAKQEEYWLDQFKGALPDLDIYMDYPRPPVQSFEGNQIGFSFEEALYGKIKQLMRRTGTTLYMVISAALNVLLHKYTGQEDIVIGTVVAGRDNVDVENILGVFINALAMRNQPKAGKTFEEFLSEVKENTLNAFENQGYPFDDLIENVEFKKDISRNPLYDVDFILLNMETPRLEVEGLTFVPLDYKFKVTQMDIVFYALETEDKIDFNLFYCTALFKQATMGRFITYFKEVVSAVVENKDIKLKDIEISHRLEVAKSNVYDDMDEALEF